MESLKRKRMYYFNSEWEEEFCFIEFNGKCICLLCNNSVAVPKRSNVERHFKSIHGNFNSEFPLKSEIRKRKIRSLKELVKKQQNFFTKPTQQSKSATVASLKIVHLLAKKKKPFTDAEIIKEAMLEAADSLFEDFKNKTEILGAIKTLQLSAKTTSRRIELIANNLEAKLAHDMGNCVFFALQLDKSTDIVNTAQLIISIRMVFNDFTTKEEYLKILPLKGRTQGIDIFSTFKNFVTENKLQMQKLTSITTDGARAMTGKENGFIGLCRKDALFPKFITYHCFIHQEMLYAKTINFNHVMSVVTKIINSIKAKATQHRLFKLLLEEENTEFKDLLLHTEVRWLSRGKILERFINLLPQIKEFITLRGDVYKELENVNWLLDLGFLADITANFNEFNVKLQGKNSHIAEMISAVNSFKCKLELFKSHLVENSLNHFQNIKRVIANSNICVEVLNTAPYIKTVDTLIVDISLRFQDLKPLESVISFFINPFNVQDKDLSDKINNYFEISNKEDLEIEIINFQHDIILKSHFQDISSWNLVDENRFPNLRTCALKIFSFCETTYNCEAIFSNMTYLKSKYRSQLTDAHLDQCLRASNSAYVLDYDKIAGDMQTQISH